MTCTPDDRATRDLLPRILPSPVPAIHPVAEIEAQGDLRKIYEDTKSVLRVPWMGVVTMAFAHYPNFYATLWQGLRPLFTSQQFEDTCRQLRVKVEKDIAALQFRPLTSDLLTQGYATQEIDAIRRLIEVLSQGNMPYLLLASLARLLLEDHPLSTQRLVNPTKLSSNNEQAPLVLMEPHHGNQQLQDLYQEIRSTLGLPFVNTDYRALARWPSYFKQAWDDLRPQIQSSCYASLVNNIHATAVKLAQELPNPGLLDPQQLQSAALQDADLEEVRDVVRLFQYLLPGLVVNVAFLRAQLLAQPGANPQQSSR